MIHKPKHSIAELAVAVNSLIGIPDYLKNTQKSQRNYGKHRLKTLESRFIELENGSVDAHDDDDSYPMRKFNEYYILLRENEFTQATEYARSWYKSLQEDMGLRK